MKISITSVFTLISFFAISVIAAPVAVASPDAVAVASPEPLFEELQAIGAINKGIANITGELTQLTTLLTAPTELPKDTLGAVVTIVLDLLKGVVSTLGGITGLEEGTDALNGLLNDTFAKLDALLANSGLDATLNQVLRTLIDAIKTLLAKILWTLNQVLDNLLHLNLVGVVASLLAGALASVDLFLSKIKNGVLPA